MSDEVIDLPVVEEQPDTEATEEVVDAGVEELPTSSVADYAARRRDRARTRRAEQLRKVPMIAIAAVIAVLVIAGVGESAASWGRIHPGVSVAGVKIGGMTQAAAKQRLEKSFNTRLQDPVTVTYSADSWVLSPEQVGLDFDVNGAVASAYSVGRSNNWLKALGDRSIAWTVGRKVVPRAIFDDDAAGVAFQPISEKTDIEPVDASVNRDGTVFTALDGKDGVRLDSESLQRLISSAVLSTDGSITAPVVTEPMDVTKSEAEKACEVARQMVSAPVTITFQTRTWEFGPEQIASWISFQRSDETTIAPRSMTDTSSSDISLVPVLTPVKVGAGVLPVLGAGIGRPAVDARFETGNGSVSIIPSQEGIGPDLVNLSADLMTTLVDSASARRVELRTTSTQPALTTDSARAMGIKDRLSKYTTEYAASNRPRVNNIHLLGDSLNGKLVAPGATFSFNGAIGERTAAKGYKEAPAIVGGKLVPQLGGGICQVGTTLFNAIFDSGLAVVERHNHSQYISHYPKGRDATVSWGGPDLKFKNDTDHWVLIAVSYTSSSITIALYGTDPGYKVTSATGDWYDVRPFPIQEVKDPMLALGSRVVDESGQAGRSIKVTRTVTKNGEVIRNDTFTSKYRAVTQVVRVGTKAPTASKTTTTVPKP